MSAPEERTGTQKGVDTGVIISPEKQLQEALKLPLAGRAAALSNEGMAALGTAAGVFSCAARGRTARHSATLRGSPARSVVAAIYVSREVLMTLLVLIAALITVLYAGRKVLMALGWP